MSGGLGVWVVYDHPKDFPNTFVARLQIADRDGVQATDNIMVSGDLDLLRSELEARGLTRLPRMEGDDPKIVETWL